jgi:hypothetical protein
LTANPDGEFKDFTSGKRDRSPTFPTPELLYIQLLNFPKLFWISLLGNFPDTEDIEQQNTNQRSQTDDELNLQRN